MRQFYVLSNDKYIAWYTNDVTWPAMMSHDPPMMSHDLPVVSHDLPMMSHDLPMMSHDSPMVSHDPPMMLHDLGWCYWAICHTVLLIHFLVLCAGYENNFQAITTGHSTTQGIPYDYDSIMHYEAYAFSRDRTQPTIEPVNNNVSLSRLGQRRGFSELDLHHVNVLYCGGREELTSSTMDHWWCHFCWKWHHAGFQTEGGGLEFFPPATISPPQESWNWAWLLLWSHQY